VDGLVALELARDELQQRVPLAVAKLDAPTPCEGWAVRDLLAHVIVGDHLAVALLDGRPRGEIDALRASLAAAEPLGGDPLRTFADSADAQAAAFARPGALEATCHTAAGPVPGRQLLTFRTCDLTVHAWDLARAVGADEALDGELVEWVHAAMAPGAASLGRTGWYGDGPSGTLPPDAPLQDRLLDLTGRRP